mgnify:CR=1 FL=1
MNKTQQNAAENENSKPKIGQGHLSAMGRAGLKELSQILPATDQSIKPIEEYGLYGTALPQEVFEEKKSIEPNVDQNLEMQM